MINAIDMSTGQTRWTADTVSTYKHTDKPRGVDSSDHRHWHEHREDAVERGQCEAGQLFYVCANGFTAAPMISQDGLTVLVRYWHDNAVIHATGLSTNSARK